MTEQLPPLEGRVAAILNARELVINIGANTGVKPGTRFAILAETPIQIRDPGTGALLDTIDREKVRVQAAEVRENITICRTYRSKGVPSSAYRVSDAMRAVLGELGRPETLQITDTSTPPPLSEEESYVKTNDRVRAVADD